MSSKRLGLDGDIMRYEIGAVCQTPEIHFGTTVLVPHSRDKVEERVNQLIERIMERSGADDYELFLSGKTNFRYDIAVTHPYKGQRVKNTKPLHWSTVGEILVNDYAAYTVHGAEADDALSIFARQDPDNFIIASRDKDLRIVPCWHYAWRCGEAQPEIPTHKVTHIGEVSARPYPSGGYKLVGNGLSFFYGQVLAGDSIDNYKGCPGIGPEKAARILAGCTTEQGLWEATQRAYITKLGPEEGLRLLIENARLAWLLDDAEVTYDANDIYISPKRLWEPPTGLPSIPDGNRGWAVSEPSVLESETSEPEEIHWSPPWVDTPYTAE